MSTSAFRHTVGSQTYQFPDLRALMARATPMRSGDLLAGVAASSARERVAAQMALAEVPLTRFLSEALVPYEEDEVTRLIVDTHDAAAFAPARHLTVGDFRNWLLSDAADSAALAALVGFIGWSSSLRIFQLGAASSILLGVYSFFLPHTPAPAKGQKIDLRALLMLDAWKLLAKPGFLVFILCSGLICIPLAYYYGLTSNYLTNAGFEQTASSMTIGQMSEIVFMLLIPFFFRRLGVKWMILVGMLAWVLRYLLFAYGAPDQVVWMLMLGIALHGICYDFFFVTGFMYTDKVAAKEIRGQAQSLLVFVTQGVGMYFGYQVAFGKFAEVSKYGELDAAIKAARPEETLSFGESLAKMFSVKMPDGVDAALISETMAQWKTFWIFPAIMALVIAAIFFAAFWDKTRVTEEGE
jgi:hypothetical protein